MRTKFLMLVFPFMAVSIAAVARGDEIDALSESMNEALRHKDGDLIIACATRILRLDPSRGTEYGVRAYGYCLKDNYEQAVADCNEVLTFELTPELKASAYTIRGSAHLSWGKYERAKSDLQQALRNHSNELDALSVYAWLLATCPEEKYRDGQEAWKLAKKAYELQPDVQRQHTLAAAYAECGDFDEAVRWQKKAIESAAVEDAKGNSTLLEKEKQELKECLRLYEQHKPFRGTPKEVNAG